MCNVKALAIGVGVPAFFAACSIAALAVWQACAPVHRFDVRGPWPEEAGKPASSQPSWRLGPPGVLTVSGAAADESIVGDWPQFLGPARNAFVADTVALARQWPSDGPKVLWSLELTAGHAGAAVKGAMVYILDYAATADKTTQGDLLRCFSLADGREIWRYWYAVPIKDDHGISRTVPAVAGRYVVTFGPAGHVMCVDAVTGRYQWGMSLTRRYKTKIPEWHASQCPLIDGDRAIFATGGRKLMIAVALEGDGDGEPRIIWETPNPMEGAGKKGLQITHSSIIATTYKGRRMYVYCSTKGVVGVSGDGELMWRYSSWRPGINAASPVMLAEGRILVSADTGCEIIRLTEGPDGAILPVTEAKMRAEVFSSYHQTPIYHAGKVYSVLSQKAGALKGQLACLDVSGDTVRQLWTSGRDYRFKWGPYVLAGSRMFLLHERGELTMARVSPSGFEPMAKSKILHHGDAWAPMALVDGRLLLRDERRMLCLDMRAQTEEATP